MPSAGQLDLGAGDRLLHYQMVEIAGAGGLGVVWKALDTKLDREVALKLLPSNKMANSHWKRRFIREAKLASALNHPNIITIYEVNCGRGIDFIAMEYVRGQTLRQLLKQGRLSPSQTLEYGIQICDALAHAHAAGIVHRDLKPGNIMVTDTGRVKVLDFGLAKFSQPSGQDGEADPTVTGPLTVAGAVLGTPAYMSPEQALGEEVDVRSDVFSLGAILYEMLSGVAPFWGDSRSAMLRKLLQYDPRPLAELDVPTPPELDSVIERCLKKDRERRYPSCVEMAAGLQAAALALSDPGARTLSIEVPIPPSRPRRNWWLITALASIFLVCASLGALWLHYRSVPSQRGVAVLPFTNVNENDRSRAFSLGLVMAVSSNLSDLDSLRKAFWVVPAGDVLKARTNSVGEAWRSFGVDLVVGGSIETTGDRVRVTAGVSDARTQRQLRSRQITIPAGDSLAIEDELAKIVGELLQVDLPSASLASIRSGASGEPAAQDYYLQGRGYLDSGAEKADPAIAVFQEALDRDPKFARAQAGLGAAYLEKFNSTKQPEWLEKARAAGRVAIQIGGRTPEALITLGAIARAEGRYEESASLLLEVVHAEPRNREGWLRLAEAYDSLQKPKEAEDAYRRAIAVQPGYPGGHQSLGRFYYLHGRYGEAVASFERERELAPDNYNVYNLLGAVYLQTGRYAQAETALNRSLALEPNAIAYNNLASCYFYREQYARSVPMMEKAVQLGIVSVPALANLARVYRLTPALSAKAPPVEKRAFDLAESILKTNPRDAETHADLAWLKADTGDKNGAESEIQEARRLAPASGPVLIRAVLVYEALGKRSQALTAYNALVQTGGFLEEIQRRPELKSLRNDTRFKGQNGGPYH